MTSLILNIVSFVFSVMIFFQIISYGFFVAFFALIINIGVGIGMFPLLLMVMPNVCETDIVNYVKLLLQFAFFMLVRSLTPESNIYLYLIGYNILYIGVSIGVPIITCPNNPKKD